MGQAKKRGSFEERKQKAIERDNALAAAREKQRKQRIALQTESEKAADFRVASALALMSAFSNPILFRKLKRD